MKTCFTLLSVVMSFSFMRAQENFSISYNDTLKYQVTQKPDWYTKNDSTIYPANHINLYVDLGTLNNGDNPSLDFRITNESNDPMLFTNVGWGEPMFAPTYTRDPVAKGQTTILNYRCPYCEGRPGPFWKTAYAVTNLGEISITFQGRILPPTISIDPRMKMQELSLGDTATAQFRIYNKADSAMTINHLQTDWNTFVHYDEEEMANYENQIPVHSYRTFFVSYAPIKKGNSAAKAVVNVSGTDVEFDIFASVPSGKKK